MSALVLATIVMLIPGISISPKFQEEKVYTVSEVNVKPQPLKGMDDFQRRWSRTVKYPDDAIRDNIQGLIFIEFLVQRNGAITDSKIKTGLSEECDQAALEVFQDLTRQPWKPAIKNGVPVKVKMVLPFSFTIIKR